jgi:hypothetical protein
MRIHRTSGTIELNVFHLLRVRTNPPAFIRRYQKLTSWIDPCRFNAGAQTRGVSITFAMTAVGQNRRSGGDHF